MGYGIVQSIIGRTILSLAGGQAGIRSEYPEIAEIAPIQELMGKEGSMVPIIGSPEMGKTIMAYRIAEIIGRPTFAFSPAVKPKFPWVTRLDNLSDILRKDKVPRKSTVILDDVLGYASSKDYSDPEVRKLEKIIPEARHKRKIILIMCTQSSSLTDKYLLTGPMVLLKMPSVLFADLERQSVKKLQDRAAPFFEGKSDAFLQRHAYVVAHRYEGLVFIKYPGSDGGPIIETPEEEEDNELSDIEKVSEEGIDVVESSCTTT